MILGMGLATLVASAPLAAQGQSGCGMGQADSGRQMDHAMMMRMDSMDIRLDSLAMAMNRATGTRKINAMVGLLNTIVQEHQQMRQSMHKGPMNMCGMAGMSGTASGREPEPCDNMQMPGTDSGGSKPDHQHQ